MFIVNKTLNQEQDKKLSEMSHLLFSTWQFVVIVASYLAIQNHSSTQPSAPLKHAHRFRDVVS
jgi:hypothetical protein